MTADVDNVNRTCILYVDDVNNTRLYLIRGQIMAVNEDLTGFIREALRMSYRLRVVL